MSYFTGIQCDKCGRGIGWNDALSKQRLQHLAKHNGWSIDKQTICPECRKPRKEKGKEREMK